jgi:hypothetical protein
MKQREKVVPKAAGKVFNLSTVAHDQSQAEAICHLLQKRRQLTS